MNQRLFFIGVTNTFSIPISQNLGMAPYEFPTVDAVKLWLTADSTPPILAVIDASEIMDSPAISEYLKGQFPAITIVILKDGLLHGEIVEWIRANVSDVFDKSESIVHIVERIAALLSHPMIQAREWDYLARKGITQALLQTQENELKSKIQQLVPQLTLPPIPTTPRPTILVVDDEPWMRKSYKIFLKDHFEIEEAEDGRAALEKVIANPTIDVVVLDIRMPHMRGDEALVEIKKINPFIEAIILTAYEDTDVALHTLRNGGSDYLNKPVSKSELIQKTTFAVEVKQVKELSGVKLPFHRRIYLFYQFAMAARATGTPIYISDVREFLDELVDPTLENRMVTVSEIESFMYWNHS